MIVRIMTEGQYRLTDEVRARVNELDNACVEAAERGDERAFEESFARLLEFVRSDGIELAGDDLEPSDVLIPPPDTNFPEAARDFSGEGLIPER